MIAPGRTFFENWTNRPRPRVTRQPTDMLATAMEGDARPIIQPTVAPARSRPKQMRDLTTTSS